MKAKGKTSAEFKKDYKNYRTNKKETEKKDFKKASEKYLNETKKAREDLVKA